MATQKQRMQFVAALAREYNGQLDIAAIAHAKYFKCEWHVYEA
jgi:hypothetical protein